MYEYLFIFHMARFLLFFEADYNEYKVDNPPGEYYSNIPLAHTHMPSISRTEILSLFLANNSLSSTTIWYPSSTLSSCLL